VAAIRLYRTEAIVLRRRDFGEADRILTLYTPDRGKLSAIAKGVRRLTSRQGGHVELFTHASLLLAEGRNLDVVTQAETLDAFPGLREDLARTTYAYHVAETTDRFTREGMSSPATFHLLCDSLAAIALADDASLAARYFELRLLDLLGYRPELHACPECGRILELEGNAFGMEAGGVLCPACAPGDPRAIPLPGSAFRVLRFLQSQDWSVASQVSITVNTRSVLEHVMNAYVRHYLERDLASVEFIHQLREAGDPLGWGRRTQDGAPTPPEP
jgi:DNA repair protein RecO (recombination protein O)